MKTLLQLYNERLDIIQLFLFLDNSVKQDQLIISATKTNLFSLSNTSRSTPLLWSSLLFTTNPRSLSTRATILGSNLPTVMQYLCCPEGYLESPLISKYSPNKMIKIINELRSMNSKTFI